jgi:hypothetical protein
MYYCFLYNFFSEKFLILRRTEQDLIKIYIGVHVKYRLFLSDFNEHCIFQTVFFSKKTQISNFVKISPMRGELFHADRRYVANTCCRFFAILRTRLRVIKHTRTRCVFFFLKQLSKKPF